MGDIDKRMQGALAKHLWLTLGLRFVSRGREAHGGDNAGLKHSI